MHSSSPPFRFKAAPEDFIVEELPLAVEEPDPAGTHVWFTLEKRGVSTPEATRRLARALSRKPQEISFAGRKDAVAVTRQRMSIEHVEIDELLALDLDAMQIRDPLRCRRKLRVGQLFGNRFHLRLTSVEERLHAPLERALAELSESGVPNRYGAQRFGRNGLVLGRALAHGRSLEYLEQLALESTAPAERAATDELLRRVASGTTSERRRATELAADLPEDFKEVVQTLARRRPEDPADLVRSVPRRTRAFHLAILQAKMFNDVLAQRVLEGSASDAAPGDVIVGGDGRHSVYRGGPLAAGATVTGPIWSADMLRAEGRAGEIEQEALTAEGLEPEHLASPGGLKPRGARRRLTIDVDSVQVGAWQESGVWVAFDLPVGSYATVVLDEIGRRVAR